MMKVLFFPKTQLLLLSIGLFVLVPLKGGAFLNGIPLDHPIDIVVILFLIFIFFILEWKAVSERVFGRVRIFLIICILLKFGLYAVLLPHGLKGFYYGNRDFSGGYERSTEFRGLDATRIDPQISFSNVGYSLTKTPFQLWFLNAYNINTFDFSIIWKGFLYVPKTQSVRFSLISNEIHKLSIDGQFLIDSQSPGLQKDFSDLYLTQGFHPIEISYIYTPHSNMALNFRWFLGGKEKTVDSQYLYPAQPSQVSFMMDEFFYGFQVFFIGLLFLLPIIFIIYFVRGVGVKSLVGKERFWLFCFVTFFLIQCFITVFKLAQGADFNILSR